MFDTAAKLGMLRKMMLIRALEQAWGAAYLQGEIDGIPPALSMGQEAVAVGACAVLEAGDFVFTTHRGQAAQVARDLPCERILAELYCRSDGCNKGKSYHVTDVRRGVIGMGGIVGAQVPVAGGMALAQRMRGTDRVSLAFLGDGAMNEGAVHETCNLAAMWQLPLVVICENNGYCISQKAETAIRIPSLAARADAYGFPGVVVDGNDPLAVAAATASAVARARAGDGATLIEARTTRMGGHLVHDPQSYRPAAEIAAAAAGCPIERFAGSLIADGVLTDERRRQLDAAIAAEIAAAVDYARRSPPPPLAAAYEDLWADAALTRVTA